MHNLKTIQVKQAQPKQNPWKLADGGSLYLLINPNGSKYWRYDYRYGGKKKTMAIGVYPEVCLKKAREKHLEARNKINDGIDPNEQKRIEKLTCHINTANSFESIALEWFNTKVADKSEGHRKRTLRALQRDLFPTMGKSPIINISSPELLAALQRIEKRGAIETARRAKQTAGQIFRYAIATGRAERDPSRDLDGALKNPVK